MFLIPKNSEPISSTLPHVGHQVAPATGISKPKLNWEGRFFFVYANGFYSLQHSSGNGHPPLRCHSPSLPLPSSACPLLLSTYSACTLSEELRTQNKPALRHVSKADGHQGRREELGIRGKHVPTLFLKEKEEQEPSILLSLVPVSSAHTYTGTHSSAFLRHELPQPLFS